MKKLYSLSLAIGLFIGQQVTAKQIYLSPQGNDEQNGLTEATAVKSLLKVDEIVAAGDTVNIKGIIKITEEPGYAQAHLTHANAPAELDGKIYLYHRGWMIRSIAHWENVTFLGQNPETDGFSGENESPLFQMNGSRSLTFENILFTKALAWKAPGAPYASDGAVGWLRPSTTGQLRFKNCVIKDSNQGLTFKDEVSTLPKVDDTKHGTPQGAFWIGSGNIFFDGCVFENNRSKKGGAICMAGGDVVVSKCEFIDNDCASIDDTRGGAIYTFVNESNKPHNLTITQSLFENNTAHKDGGAICMRNESSSGDGVLRTINVIIDRCSFIGNSSLERGGAIELNASSNQTSVQENLKITNSLFYGNNSILDGGTILLWNTNPGEFALVNSTLYQNFTAGNAGHCAGLIFMKGYDWNSPTNTMKKVYNCIFDGNYSTQEEVDKLADFSSRIDLGLADDKIDFKNNYIGWYSGGVDVSLHPGFGATNRMRYQTTQDFSAYDGALTGFEDADYYAINYHAVPLSESADAHTFGNAIYLTQYNITKDLSGKTRTVADGKCAIGACEVTSKELDDEVIFSSVHTTNFDENIHIAITNGILFCPEISSQSIRSIEVYSLSGNKVAWGQQVAHVDKLTAGTYIVRIIMDNKVHSQKMIIK